MSVNWPTAKYQLALTNEPGLAPGWAAVSKVTVEGTFTMYGAYYQFANKSTCGLPTYSAPETDCGKTILGYGSGAGESLAYLPRNGVQVLDPGLDWEGESLACPMMSPSRSGAEEFIGNETVPGYSLAVPLPLASLTSLHVGESLVRHGQHRLFAGAINDQCIAPPPSCKISGDVTWEPTVALDQ